MHLPRLTDEVCVTPLLPGSKHGTPSLWYAGQGEKELADWDDNSIDVCETASAAYQQAHIKGMLKMLCVTSLFFKSQDLRKLESRTTSFSSDVAPSHHLHPRALYRHNTTNENEVILISELQQGVY